MRLDIAVDGVFEIGDGFEHAASDFSARDRREKCFKRLAIYSQLESARDSAVKLSQRRQIRANSHSAQNEEVGNC